MIKASITFETPVSPRCAYPLPPYQFIGRGIAIIYEIPFSRVKDAIPSVFAPDPGKRKIWFMINFYEWQSFFPASNPKDKFSFCEAYYKFSVSHRSKLGDYPVKLYLTSEAGIASGIELYGYPKFLAGMKFEMKNGEGSFAIERKGNSELEMELSKARGITAGIMSFFANVMAKSYIKRYTGNFLFKNEGSEQRMIHGLTRINTIRYDLASIKRIILREPLEWNILTEAEMQKPKYAFILSDITARLEPPARL